jgi:hypothetical protein
MPGCAVAWLTVTRRGSLRASDAERDAVVARLHRAATEGRIGSDELEHRVSVALKACTYGELDAVVADLPTAPRQRSRSRHPAAPAARWAARSVRANPMLLLIILPVMAVTFAVLIAATVLWAVIVVVAMVLGHRGGGPWIAARGSRGWPYWGMTAPAPRRARRL